MFLGIPSPAALESTATDFRKQRQVHKTSEKLSSKNICIATEIVSISVSVANLLVLPVLGTVSTSRLYLKSDNVDTGGSGSGVP